MISSHPAIYRALQNDPLILAAISRLTHPGSALGGALNQLTMPRPPPAAPRASPVAISAMPHIQIAQNGHSSDCGCKKPKGPKALADFMVNVPCPKPTEKPPRKVVVKLPCPTTKKPCTCQCCPCNPCKSKPKKESCSSESNESVEVKTYTPKKHNEVRHPYHVHRVHVSKSSEEVKVTKPKYSTVRVAESSEETKPRPAKKQVSLHAHRRPAHYRVQANSHSNSSE